MSINTCERYAPERCLAEVKRECLIAAPSKARLIQYYFNLRTQAAYAPNFYALQKVVTNRLRRYPMGRCDITFGSGMNAGGVAAWMDSVVSDGVAWFYERDGKCWDATMSRFHADARIRLYDRVDPALAAFASQCVRVRASTNPRGRGRQRVLRYSLESTVKSGHNDTTLGNSIVNAMIAHAVFDVVGVRASILVAGDDLLVAVYQDYDFDAVVGLERQYGIRPEARKFRHPEDVSFTSGIFVLLGERYAFIPKPGRLLAKLWWTVNNVSSRDIAAYRRGVALSLMPSCHDIPVVRAFLSPHASAGRVIMSDRGFKYRGVEFSGDFTRWFYHRYHTNASEVAQLECLLLANADQVVFISHPLLERLVEVDGCDLDDRDVIEG